MFYKDRDIPYKLKAEEALIRRLDGNHPKLPIIEEEYRKTLAGIRGEKELDYHLSSHTSNYLIINDLRLKQGAHFFQIDSLLISPKVSFIVDSKNIAGTIIFDHEFNQCIRIFNEKEEGIRDPFTQVQRHIRMLSRWLDEHKLPSLNLDYLIAISRPSTIIKSKGTNSYSNFRVVHAAHLISRISDLEKRHPKEEITTIKEIKRIAKQLVKYHIPFKPNIFDTYSINPNDVKNGVQCPHCKALSMQKVYGRWYCPLCQTSSKTAHIPALRDYYFLYGCTITLSQFSNFLLLPKSKRKSASSFLISLNLPSAGSKKGRVYDLTPLIEK